MSLRQRGPMNRWSSKRARSELAAQAYAPTDGAQAREAAGASPAGDRFEEAAAESSPGTIELVGGDDAGRDRCGHLAATAIDSWQRHARWRATIVRQRTSAKSRVKTSGFSAVFHRHSPARARQWRRVYPRQTSGLARPSCGPLDEWTSGARR